MDAPLRCCVPVPTATTAPLWHPRPSLNPVQCVRASLKSNDGLLYPLDRSLLFIHKPTTYLRYTDISSVELQVRFRGLDNARPRNDCVYAHAVHIPCCTCLLPPPPLLYIPARSAEAAAQRCPGPRPHGRSTWRLT